jgi:hypothetical protein
MKLLLDLPIAGLQHYATSEMLRELCEEDELKLVREPGNKFDQFAVRIDTVSDVKLGYVPRTYSQFLATLLDTKTGNYHADVGDLISPRQALCHFRLWLVD